MGSVEPIESMFQFTLISLHTDFEFPANQCEAGTPCNSMHNIHQAKLKSGHLVYKMYIVQFWIHENNETKDIINF